MRMPRLAILAQVNLIGLKPFVSSGEARLRIAETLTGSRERIVKQAGDQLFARRPDVVSPGGNAYGEEMTATCLRDMGLLFAPYHLWRCFRGYNSN